ncbi:PorT family protein [bacterium]|nr:PorT family protein [bacterium]
MKKIVLAGLLASSLLVLSIQGEPIKFGVISRVNSFNFLSNSGLESTDADFGFSVGASASLDVDKRLSLRAEVNYVEAVSKGTYRLALLSSSLPTKFNVIFVQVPLLAVYSIDPIVNVYGGGYVTSLISPKTGAYSYESLSCGVIGGLELKLLENLTLDSRYTLGLTNFDKNSSSSLKGFEFGARYTF